MENITITKTNISPEVNFNTNGKLSITGRILTENAVLTFEPLFKWINELTCSKIVFEINLEYMNTSAAMQLYNLMRQLDTNCSISEIEVKWYYDEDDEDHLETGEIFSEKLYRTKFYYFENQAA